MGAGSSVRKNVVAKAASNNGLHGQRAMWKIKKMDELDALCVTIKRLL